MMARRIIAGRKRGGWTPVEMNMALWLDAADVNTITLDTTAVVEWSDKSGNDNHATQSGASRPTFDVNGQNGLSVISFNGVDQWMALSTPIANTSSSTLSFFAVFSHNNNPQGVIVSSRPTTGAEGWSLREKNGDKLQYYHTGFPPTESPAKSGVSLAQFVRDGLAVSLGSDGSLDAPQSMGGYNESSVFVLGAENGGTTNYLDGILCEIIAIARVISETEREIIEGYLAHKWGTAAYLSPDHPYKSAAP